MNIVMTSLVHPDTPHISAVRAACFARELSSLGHRVILLTTPLVGRSTAGMVKLHEHDWTTPLVLEAENPSRPSRSLPLPLGKLATVLRMLVSGGSRGAWVVNAVRCIRSLAPEYKPDLVWCTFGQFEAVVAARRIARETNCPWILDIKDGWELYVPKGLRRLMALRVRGWSVVTANAEINGAMAKKWLGADASIIYSGVAPAFLSAPTGLYDDSCRFITVVGGLYSANHLSTLLCGIKKWLQSLDPQVRESFCIKYLGGDIAMFKVVADACIPDIRIEMLGYLPTSQMADVCRLAVANLYVGHSGGFHHKLLELLACRRPLIVCPGESEESRRLARQVGGLLHESATESQVSDNLTLAFSQVQNLNTRVWDDGSNIQAFSWPQQTLKLEAILANLFKGRL